jgi:NADH dehydrogenase
MSQKICILGGGFGGLYTALRLNNLPWAKTEKPEIVLVDQRDRFVFSPLLYELVTGELQSWEVAPPYEELLEGTDIRFRQAAVADIDLNGKHVRLDDGETLTYDRLMLAMGGETPLDFVPGATEFAIPFRTVTDAFQLSDRLRHLEASNVDKIRIAIVGAGYSGVELACKLADKLGNRARIRIVEQADQILRSSPPFNREAAQKALEERGVWTDLDTTIERITSDSISLLYKGSVDTIPVDLVLWTVGTRVAEVVQKLPLKQNNRGQLITTPTLQVADRPEIFAIGDLADCKDADGQQVPSTAQAAFQQADYAGWNIWASLTNRPLLPFRYQYLGEMMTLGINDATLTGLGIQLDGTFAYLIRRLAYLNRMPTLKHQLRVGINWLTRPVINSLVGNNE